MLRNDVDPRWKSRDVKVRSVKTGEGTSLPIPVTQQLDNLFNTVTQAAEMILQSAGDNLLLRVHAASILRASREGTALIKVDGKLS